MKKWLAWLLCVMMLASFCGCGKQEAQVTTPTAETTAETTESNSVSVGLCLPNQSDERWITEGAALKEGLEAKGYRVTVEDANNDILLQAEQVKKLAEENVQCLVVAAVDSAALTHSLAFAQNAGIPVLAYDRLLLNSDGVTGCVVFDHFRQGLEMARKIAEVKALETAKAEKRSYSVEFLMDTYEDHSNVLYYQGIMEGLKGYLDTGVLKCPSQRTLFEDVCVKGADPAKAQSLCETLLTEHYEQTWPQILITGSDVLSGGCVAALNAKGCPAGSWPLIAGRNATAQGIARIVAGQQMFTTYFDGAALVQAAVGAVEAVLAGNAVGKQSLANGMTEVPAALLKPELITVDNYETLLIDTGVFTREQLAEN